MAHTATIAALTEELVTVILDLEPKKDSRRIKVGKDSALRTLRHHTYGRVNQFDVQGKLDGLDEKFRVLNNEPLADALKKRLEKLGKISHRWKPEILFLLLNISDRPVDKSRVEDLDLLRPPKPQPSLTWAEIIAEDPLTEKGIWDQPDFDDGEPSEDEYSLVGEEFSKAAQDTRSSTVREVEVLAPVEGHFVKADRIGLEAVERSQFWRRPLPDAESSNELVYEKRTQQITELQAVRECIFMLFGLPTHLFEFGWQEASFYPSSAYSIEHVSSTTLVHVLLEFAEIGSILEKLRRWLRRKFTVPLIQTFHYAVERRLQTFQEALGHIEKQLVSPSGPLVVSLQAILSEVKSIVSCLLELAAPVDRVPSRTNDPHYSCLELLYQQACDSQMIGNMENFEYFARIFFDCLQTYLRLINQWMKEGEIDEGDRTFFVQIAKRECDVSSFWHERYELRELSDGAVHAPMFVRIMAKRIFNTGKSVAFLKAIGNYEETKGEDLQHLLNYETVCGEDTEVFVAPFAEVFPLAFEQWVRQSHQSSAQRLHEQLDRQCGLWNTLDNLEYVYFSRNGAIFQTFAFSIFERLERKRGTWNDRFILTDLAQSTFGVITGVDGRRLTVRTKPGTGKTTTGKIVLPSLSTFVVDYAYPWPVMNIIRKSTLVTYQQISTLLLQVLRARFHLLKITLPPSTIFNEETRLTCLLRQRLLWFTNALHAYIADIVLMTSTAQMRKRLAAAEDVDAMTEIHQTYIGHLAAECLLTKNLEPIHRAITSVLDLCVEFSQVQTFEITRLAGGELRALSDSLIPPHTGGGKSLGQSPPRRTRRHQDSDDSDADGDEYGTDDVKHSRTLPYLERLQEMLRQFDELYHFILAGIRGVSRAGGETSWEILAEKLEWK